MDTQTTTANKLLPTVTVVAASQARFSAYLFFSSSQPASIFAAQGNKHGIKIFPCNLHTRRRKNKKHLFSQVCFYYYSWNKKKITLFELWVFYLQHSYIVITRKTKIRFFLFGLVRLDDGRIKKDLKDGRIIHTHNFNNNDFTLPCL